MKTNKMVIVSADPMDAEYLNTLFADSVHVEKKTNFVRHGFHTTKEEIVCVEFTRSPVGEKENG